MNQKKTIESVLLFGEFLVYTPDRVVDEETVGLEIEVYRKMKLKKERRWKNIKVFVQSQVDDAGGLGRQRVGKGCWMLDG